MKRACPNRRPLLAMFMLGLVGLFWQAAPCAARWRAGAARVKITPENPMWMAGYASRSHPADGKTTDLWVKSLVLEDASGRRCVLVSLDLVGIDRALSGRIRGSISSRYELKRHQIALCFTHTHTGPVVGHNLDPLHYRQLDRAQQTLIDQYAKTLERRVVQCVGVAIGDLEPCRLAWGSGTAKFAVNRRNNSAADVPRLRTENRLKGPVDHDVPVLAARTAQGPLKAVLFGYACHATVLSDYLWSGDYPGFAELDLAERHPGCVAMFWAGCGADQNPLPRRSVALARKYGRQLADAVTRVLSGEMVAVSSSLETSYREAPLTLDKLPSAEQLEALARSGNKYERARAEMHLERIASGKTLEATYPYPIGVWELGDQIHFVFLGGEVVVDFALRLKSELTGTRTWVAGYANDVMAYIPSRRVLREGGYEGGGAMVYYGLPAIWAPRVEEDIVSAIHAMVGLPVEK